MKNIDIIAEIVRKNRENLTLLKECQLASTDKDKWNLKNNLLLYNIRFIILEKQNNL